MSSNIQQSIIDYFQHLQTVDAEKVITPAKAAYYQPITKALYKNIFDNLKTDVNQWGQIQGNILDQADLIAYIASQIPVSIPTTFTLIDCGSILIPNENILIDCGSY